MSVSICRRTSPSSTTPPESSGAFGCGRMRKSDATDATELLVAARELDVVGVRWLATRLPQHARDLAAMVRAVHGDVGDDLADGAAIVAPGAVAIGDDA